MINNLDYYSKKQHYMSNMHSETEKLVFSLIAEFSPWNNLPLTVKLKQHENDTLRHYHPDYYELVLVRSGEAVNTGDDWEFPIGAGDFFLLPPGVWHSYRRARGLEIYNILFGQEVLNYFKDDMAALKNTHLLLPGNSFAGVPQLFCLPEKAFPETVQLLEAVIREEKEKKPGAKTAILGYFLRAVLIFFRNGIPAGYGKSMPPDHRISLLMGKLNESWYEQWSLAEMAKFAGMSLSSFRQHFLRASGSSPGAYLLNLRLRKSLMMLKMKQNSISEVSRGCGFSDSNYFSRQFRRKFGLSPRGFAAAVQSGKAPDFNSVYEKKE